MNFVSVLAAANRVVLAQKEVDAEGHEKTAKVGIAAKRKRAGWNQDYLLKALQVYDALALAFAGVCVADDLRPCYNQVPFRLRRGGPRRDVLKKDFRYPQVNRALGAGSKMQGVRGILSLFCLSLLVAVLLLWQATRTVTAQGPTPPTGTQEPSGGDALEAAHLSPDGCSELVINGGFEVTDLHWGLAGTSSPPSYSTARTFAGERSLRLGIVDSANADASDMLYQDIALPDSAQHFVLSFHYWAMHEGAPGSDVQLLNVYEATTGVRLSQPWSRLSNEQSWQFEQIDLTHFRGRNLRIVFGVHNDGGGGRTALYLDDVSLLACEPNAMPVLTPSATPQPVPTAQPVPTEQPVATAMPSGCVVSSTLQDGGFEEALRSGGDWIPGISPVPPGQSEQSFVGGWSLRLGNPPGSGTQNFSSYSSVRQLIELPADALRASLRWSHLSRSQDAATASPSLATDRQELILLTSSMATEGILYRSRAENSTWATDTVDLTPYLGGSHFLYFNVFNDGNGRRTWMFLDDIQVIVCYGGGAAPSAGQVEQPAAATAAATSSPQDRNAVATPESGTETPAPPADGEGEKTPTPPVRGTIIAVGVSTPSSIIQGSSPSTRTPEEASVTVLQRFRRILQTAQGQTFLSLLLVVLGAIGYLRWRENRRPPP